MTLPNRRRSWLLAGAATLLGGLAPAPALAQTAPAAQSQSASFAIPAQPLGDALLVFGRQSGWQVATDPALVAGRTAPAVNGALAPEAALGRLLDGSGLIWRRTAESSVVVEAIGAGGAMVLGQVSVQGQAGQASPDPDATEGSRAYAVKRASVGQKAAVPLKEIPQQVTVIPHARIEEENFTRLEEAMQTATGVTLLPSDSGRGAIFMRGFELDTFYIDGLPSTVSSAYGTQPDLFMFDRVEVLRGPSGLFGGAAEPGGTVNLARKRALAEAGGTASASVGSWNSVRGEMDVTSALNQEKTVRGRLVAAADSRDSWVKNAGMDSQMVYGTVEMDLTPATTLSIALSHDQKDKSPDAGLPGFASGAFLDVSRSTSVSPEWNRFDSTDSQGLIELQHHLEGGGEIKAATRLINRETDFKYGLSSGVVNPSTGAFNMNAIERHWDEQSIASDVHLTQPVEAWGLTHTFTVGVDHRYTNNGLTAGQSSLGSQTLATAASVAEPTIAQTSDADTTLQQRALYGEARIKPIAPLTLIAGGRLLGYDLANHNNRTDTSTSNSESGVFVPFVGAVLDLNAQISAYVSYSEAFQPQTNLTYSGDVIDPRESRQAEVGLKGAFLDDRLNAQIGVYRLVDSNRAMTDPDHTTAYLSAGKVVVKGVDAEISGRVTENLELFAGYAYAYSDTRVAAASATSVFSTWTPKHTLNLHARYSFTEGELKDFWLGGGMRAVSDYYTENTTTGARWTQDAYAVFDAQVGYAFSEAVSATLTVNNLFDKTYYARAGNGSGTTFAYYGEPFNATFKITAKF